ncbi:MAG: peptidylprolyl isomerase [Bryobacterales bacterium]|nr:peptidylprolyl isomerase [Bryobacterales bacterium]
MPDAEPSRVRLETDKGALLLELYPDRAPETVANFLQYVDDGFYDGTIFHRVIPKFMIQGGGFDPEMQEKQARPPIQNESGAMANTKYTVAMARTPDPHSASAQFFINHQTNQFLDKENARDGWGYCVFGKVVEGTDVVESIAQVQTGSKMGHQDVPLEPVVIKSARRAS